MPRKIKVLFLPRWYPHHGDSMFGLFVKHHAIAVNALADVAVLYVHQVTPGEEAKAAEFCIEDGVATLRIYFNSSPLPFFGRIFNICKYISCQNKGYRHLKKNWGIPDLCHVHVLTRPAWLALWLFIRYRIPYVITEHWSRYLQGKSYGFDGFMRKSTTRLIVRKAKAVTAVTGILRNAMLAHGLQNPDYHIVPNVVDIHRFFPKEKNSSEPFVFLHVSCFDEHAKNISGFLRVVQKLRQLRNDFQVIMTGDGLDYERSVEYSRQLGLDEKTIIFTGLLTGDELVDQYRRAGALVLFSNYETQGIVLLEAFACGTPVIASNTGGVPEIMSDDRGLLVGPGDENALLEAMIRMLDGKTFGKSNELHNYVVENFSNEAVANKFLKIYQSTLQNKFGA